jgi:cell division protein FtsL
MADDKEILIRQTILMEEMGKRVVDMEAKVNKIYDTQIGVTASELAVNKEKISRLEKIVYGAIAFIIVNLVSLVVLWIQQKH